MKRFLVLIGGRMEIDRVEVPVEMTAAQVEALEKMLRKEHELSRDYQLVLTAPVDS